MTDRQKNETQTGDSTGTTAELYDEVHYPPVENGLDYMVSVVEHLRGDKVDRRSLKYAVVHLQAAAECLLKYRLEQEHWSLVFKNPGEAKRSELDDGTLSSCTVEQTLTRLTDIAGIDISDKEKTRLKQLAKLRNQLQHYGRPHDAKVNRYVIEANAAEVLEFLVHFVDKEVLPNAAPPDGEVAESLRLIREGLDAIRGYVTARMRRLAPELEPVKPRTVKCPDCGQFALVLGDGTRCRYCHHRQEPDDAAFAYAGTVLSTGRDWAVNGGPSPVRWCRKCDTRALVIDAVTAADPADPDAEILICFNCGEQSSEIDECGYCGALFPPSPGQDSCDVCMGGGK
ncbi:hypothetical protein AB0D08_30665 [Kitasatospora sp. NPDC048540]|uniref:hypothetical protein n=1 Tax=Kitasatospora sp. NPDC048540 TaxID=3155634 RepID=UPI0033EB6A34